MIYKENRPVLNSPTDDVGEKNEKRMFPCYGNISSKCLLFRVLTREIESIMAFMSENQINVHTYKNQKVNKKMNKK